MAPGSPRSPVCPAGLREGSVQTTCTACRARQSCTRCREGVSGLRSRWAKVSTGRTIRVAGSSRDARSRPTSAIKASLSSYRPFKISARSSLKPLRLSLHIQDLPGHLQAPHRTPRLPSGINLLDIPILFEVCPCISIRSAYYEQYGHRAPEYAGEAETAISTPP